MTPQDALSVATRILGNNQPTIPISTQPLRIYVAGPITLGDQAMNIRRAIDAADALLARGFVPYVPQLSHFWHMIHPHEYETWLALDLVWLAQCQALLRLPGESKGADREVAYAQQEMGIPVFTSIDELMAWREREYGC